MSVTFLPKPDHNEIHSHLDQVFELKTVQKKAKRTAEQIFAFFNQQFSNAYEVAVRHEEYLKKEVNKIDSPPKIDKSMLTAQSKTLEDKIQEMQDAYENETDVEKRNALVFKLFLLISREFEHICHDEKQRRYEYFKEHFKNWEKNAKDPLHHGIGIVSGILGVTGGILHIPQSGDLTKAIGEAFAAASRAGDSFKSLPGSVNNFELEVIRHVLGEDKNVRDLNQGAQGQVMSQIIDFLRFLREQMTQEANTRQAVIGQ